MSGLGTPFLVLIFAAGAGATWFAGVYLSKTTDALDRRLGLGEALGGLILLAVAGTLPEIAIVASASLGGHLDLAVGNLIGGVAIQTLILVVLDFAAGRERPLSFLVGSLVPVLEALMVVVVLATVLGGAALPAHINVGGISPTSIAAVVFWLGGLWVVNRVRLKADWKVEMPGSRPGRRHVREKHPQEPRPYVTRSTAFVAAVFGAASVVTLGRRRRPPGVRQRPRRPDGTPGRDLRRDRAGPRDGAAGDLERDRRRAARRPPARDAATSSAATRSRSRSSCSRMRSPARP